MQYWVYSIISYFTDLEKKKEKTKSNTNVLGTPYSYYLHLCDGWNWGQRARGCLLLAYVESICFTFSKKAFKMCTLGNFTTKVSQDKEMKKSDTFCIIWMCRWWCDSLLVLKCYAIVSRETDHNIILKASVFHTVYVMYNHSSKQREDFLYTCVTECEVCVYPYAISRRHLLFCFSSLKFIFNIEWSALFKSYFMLFWAHVWYSHTSGINV